LYLNVDVLTIFFALERYLETQILIYLTNYSRLINLTNYSRIVILLV
jgi:hypothetical protein